MSVENVVLKADPVFTREQLLHALYEAAELEHTLMCTYLYAAFSMRRGEAEGLSAEEAAAVESWRGTLLRVAIDEMGHLTAIWNITSALGGSPRFGRDNFPITPGALPAGVVVRLAPFNEAVLQHFIHLERPANSSEADGEGFAPELVYQRGGDKPRLTPMAIDYDTVGTFYDLLGQRLTSLVAHVGEDKAFVGDPLLQLSPSEVKLTGANPVLCSKTALAAFRAIIEQGEGAPEDSEHSHYQRFLCVARELRALTAKNPEFQPAHPAAVNPVLRRPLHTATRVWIENEEAARVVDLGNAAYALMLRLLAHSYMVPRPLGEKGLAVDLSMGLMRAVTHLGEHAARLPAGAANVDCNAGMSFTALRDASPLQPGPAARQFFVERLEELRDACRKLDQSNGRVEAATRQLEALATRGAKGFAEAAREAASAALKVVPSEPIAARQGSEQPAQRKVDGIEYVEGKDLTLIYEGKKCIHSRFCVTLAPTVFLANVQGPWIHPDTLETEMLVEVAHDCVSGAIRYQRKDGKHDEQPPPVNLASVREGGPYAFRGELVLDGEPIAYRATLCRCGASKNKPFCDGSHHEVGFSASGEPATVTPTDMLAVRNGPLHIDPQQDGPYQVRGNLEILSGTGRMVSRPVSARLCRCGASANKPFCDNSHQRIGFRS
jgi:CDGSH-type Zn-finger protein/uncharacterized Fe-S cluster protein YjdI